jgi:hypothetical protein
VNLNTVQLLLESSVILAHTHKKIPPLSTQKIVAGCRLVVPLVWVVAVVGSPFGLGMTQVTVQPHRVKLGFGSLSVGLTYVLFSE